MIYNTGSYISKYLGEITRQEAAAAIRKMVEEDRKKLQRLERWLSTYQST
jgi:hypothetical protein